MQSKSLFQEIKEMAAVNVSELDATFLQRAQKVTSFNLTSKDFISLKYKKEIQHLFRTHFFPKFNLDNTISTLRMNNIPYQMFDLDNDNYTDVYKGWDIQLPRDYTHLKQCWVGCEENYKEVEKMAKEYLSLTKKTALRKDEIL